VEATTETAATKAVEKKEFEDFTLIILSNSTLLELIKAMDERDERLEFGCRVG
jgi:hypothetical protein